MDEVSVEEDAIILCRFAEVEVGDIPTALVDNEVEEGIQGTELFAYLIGSDILGVDHLWRDIYDASSNDGIVFLCHEAKDIVGKTMHQQLQLFLGVYGMRVVSFQQIGIQQIPKGSDVVRELRELDIQFVSFRFLDASPSQFAES